MGTGASVSRCSDAEEELDGDEIDDEFTKNIPDEYLQRKQNVATALRSVGSRKKRLFTSVSLRSAYDESETERLRKLLKDSEDLCQKKESEIGKLRAAKDEMESVNRRLRGELRVLQATCMELRNEKEGALAAKEQVLQRAGIFEEGKQGLNEIMFSTSIISMMFVI